MKRDDRSPAAYRRDVTGAQRELLEAIRAVIREVAPDVREGIAHGMLDYPGLANLGAQKEHVALYVAPAVLAKHRASFPGVGCGKSCLRFTRLEHVDAQALARLLREVRKHRRTGAAHRAARQVATGLALLFVVACAPTYHTAEVVRYDLATRAHLEARAQAECQARLAPLAGPPPAPTEPFRTDGCSVWPDAMFTGDGWQACCIDHDIAYWCGGTAKMRSGADAELRRCVGREYAGWMGAVMQGGVCIGGAPWVPAYFRWGYGHPYPAGYFEAAE